MRAVALVVIVTLATGCVGPSTEDGDARRIARPQHGTASPLAPTHIPAQAAWEERPPPPPPESPPADTVPDPIPQPTPSRERPSYPGLHLAGVEVVGWALMPPSCEGAWHHEFRVYFESRSDAEFDWRIIIFKDADPLVRATHPTRAEPRHVGWGGICFAGHLDHAAPGPFVATFVAGFGDHEFGWTSPEWGLIHQSHGESRGLDPSGGEPPAQEDPADSQDDVSGAQGSEDLEAHRQPARADDTAGPVAAPVIDIDWQFGDCNLRWTTYNIGTGTASGMRLYQVLTSVDNRILFDHSWQFPELQPGRSKTGHWSYNDHCEEAGEIVLRYVMPDETDWMWRLRLSTGACAVCGG